MNKREVFEQRLVRILKTELEYANKKECCIKDACTKLLEVKNNYYLTKNNLDDYIEDSISYLKAYIYRLNELIKEADTLRESIEEAKDYVSAAYEGVNFLEPNRD